MTAQEYFNKIEEFTRNKIDPKGFKKFEKWLHELPKYEIIELVAELTSIVASVDDYNNVSELIKNPYKLAEEETKDKPHLKIVH
tara:strand:+ start:57 stop:308 length:252 start_codon:yes stop_codon:yes gene_type:complete